MLILTTWHVAAQRRRDPTKNLCECISQGYLNGTFLCSPGKPKPKEYDVSKLISEMVTTVLSRCPALDTMFEGKSSKQRKKDLDKILKSLPLPLPVKSVSKKPQETCKCIEKTYEIGKIKSCEVKMPKLASVIHDVALIFMQCLSPIRDVLPPKVPGLGVKL